MRAATQAPSVRQQELVTDLLGMGDACLAGRVGEAVSDRLVGQGDLVAGMVPIGELGGGVREACRAATMATSGPDGQQAKVTSRKDQPPWTTDRARI